MSPLRTTLAFLCVVVAVAHAGECPPGSIPGFPNYQSTAPCYLFERFPTQFVTAERMCRDSHGHLASIPDGFVNAFVAHGANEAFLVMEVADFWIGGQNLEDQSVWRWADDQPFSYMNWDKTEPNNGTRNRCTTMKLVDGKWNSQECFDRKPYVCELGFIHGNSSTTTAVPTTPKWLTTSGTEEPTWMTTLDTLEAEMTTESLPSTSTTAPEVSTSTPEQTTTETTPPPTSTSTKTSTSTPKVTTSSTTTTTITTTPSTTTTEEPELVPTCPEGWMYIEEWEGGADQCYNVFAGKGWLEDQVHCEEQNGSLVSIHNKAQFLKTFIFRTKATPGKVDVTIGLKEEFEGDARVWKWVDDSPFDYRDWMDGFPKEAEEGQALRCVTYNTQVASYNPEFGRWKHVDCETTQARAVCEREPDWEPEENIFPNRGGRREGRLRSRMLTRAERVSQ